MNQINKDGFIPFYGGYRHLFSYQKSEIVYDATIYFCDRFFSKYDRTVGQMTQAARSGKQNIAEASMASGLSKETEITLTNVAYASLEELKLDYEDFLRSNNLKLWEKNDPKIERIRELNRSVKQATYDTFKKAIEHKDPEISANSIICLIKLTCFLLSQQIKSLEKDLVNNGGIRERIKNARINKRKS